MNSKPRTIVDINILQTIPPSNVNRDDTGSPKTALYGGVRRARVSSQAWKRAARIDFDNTLDRSELGVRTKRVVEELADRITGLNDELPEAAAVDTATKILEAGKIKVTAPRVKKGEEPKTAEAGYLLFLSNVQFDSLAQLGVEMLNSDDPAAVLKNANVKKTLDTHHSIDLALFGRMVADSSDLNVDAACQVAHALSVHAVENEFDYFTAVDDVKAADETSDDQGAAMIGTVEFNSSTLYRFATVDVDRLAENLGSADAARRAVEAFVSSFVTSMPTGKQNTFANRTLPEAVVVTLRDTQSVNLIGAFEEPVTGTRVAAAAAKLAAYSSEIDANYGTAPVASWVLQAGTATAPLLELGTKSSLAELVAGVGTAVSARIGA
ncbi:CRISPR system Cascade subunit CasC [Leucobacter luti]|uniref:CRISPR system Cascade subunit CasC n=1 Tax=Leucobacter luti TaxID=340320 RepID=A0A4R6RZE8_9MICO|nr:type I-E CRISPR-associated protein Cas7/Cse4/CasC [Leucobacter luti]TDP92579.1 CRISPR system Cascade subunit CasC [Leucobacter luti]